MCCSWLVVLFPVQANTKLMAAELRGRGLISSYIDFVNNDDIWFSGRPRMIK